MHAVRNVHSVCQWGILSIVDPQCKKTLCNRAVFHCVWSWQANIKQTLRRWVVLHLSSLSRSLFHFLSSFILSVPFSFLVPFLHTLVPKPLNAPCCFETLVKKKQRINYRLCLMAWTPISAEGEHNPAGGHFKSYNRKFEGMSWFDIYQNRCTHTHPSSSCSSWKSTPLRYC